MAVPPEQMSSKTNEDAPEGAVEAIKKKEAPPETAFSTRQRYYVLASFWAIIVLFGLPIWWKTTAIYRASLPLDQMMDWADGRVMLAEETCPARANRSTGMPSSISSSNFN
jgi:phosphatidylinositol glycan class S